MAKLPTDYLILLTGKLVARTRNGKTTFYIQRVKTTTDSSKQKQKREKFAQAVTFAKSIISDPVLKAKYEAKAKKANKESPYAMAVSEYLKRA